MKDDTISRAAVIDTLLLGKEILSRVLDDMDVVGTDREKYSWGLGLIESTIKDIEELPSAQRLLEDGTLVVTVPNLSGVHRVIVDEENSQYCKTFYQDGDND